MKNVILLTVDALRKDVLGCYSNNDGLTPFIDSLRGESIIFTKAQAVGPYTQASFPGILTSSYYLEYGNPDGLSPKRTLISEIMKKHGIVTAGFHSNPYCSAFFGWNRGWDIFYDSMKDETEPNIPYIRGYVINSKIDTWLASHIDEGENRPLFLWLHYMDIHEPYLPQSKYLNMTDNSTNPNQEEMLDLFKNVLLTRDVSDEGKIKRLKKLYDAQVRETDDYIKQFFGILDKYNLLANSIVILTADHGDEFNEHGGLSHDDKMYAELIDIPLIIYGLSEYSGQTCQTLVSNIDIPPTIVNLFGMEPAASFEGHSLFPLETYPEKGCFGEAIDRRSQKGGDINKDIYFYRERNLKIIYRAHLDNWEMYDLDKDPKELNNIVDISPAAKDLKTKLEPRVRRWYQQDMANK